MSWNYSMAKEWFKDYKHDLYLPNGKKVKAAINREADFEDAHLVIKHHLNIGDLVVINNHGWEVIGHEGLGMFLSPEISDFRIYILYPIICFKPGDVIIHKKSKKKFKISGFNKNYHAYETDKNQLISIFFPDEFEIAKS